MTEEEKLLALASKIENISDVEDLASAFADWLTLCPESKGVVNALRRCIVRNS
jgi:hypothetical protein